MSAITRKALNFRPERWLEHLISLIQNSSQIIFNFFNHKGKFEIIWTILRMCMILSFLSSGEKGRKYKNWTGTSNPDFCDAGPLLYKLSY